MLLAGEHPIASVLEFKIQPSRKKGWRVCGQHRFDHRRLHDSELNEYFTLMRERGFAGAPTRLFLLHRLTHFVSADANARLPSLCAPGDGLRRSRVARQFSTRGRHAPAILRATPWCSAVREVTNEKRFPAETCGNSGCRWPERIRGKCTDSDGRSPGVDVADDEPRRHLRRGHAQSPSSRTLAHLAHVPPVAIGFQPFRRSRMALTSQAFLNEIA